ncbi:glycogen debranching protein GlgX [Microlunatus spumicola]|uniref:Glycogen debranching protein GlgX n=1 Tax=Microlunatus spumicola TaxID=81499 RepID=A0ABP6WUY7_9ACTN
MIITREHRTKPYPLGVRAVGDGLEVAVYSETADAVDLCVFDSSGNETAHRLPERSGHVFHGRVDGLGVGTRYGLRVEGAWDPANGLRHNAHKLLLDPYATAIEGEFNWDEAVFSHRFDAPDEMNPTDSAPFVPRCVVTDQSFDWGDDTAPLTPLDETVVYETHVKGFTKTHPDVPEELRGTYAGLAHPAAVQYLVDLGVTAVELIPVQQFAQDSHLLENGLRNYWGYNTYAFFAPNADYSASGDGGQQVVEFKQMVKTLHAAGLEVILDVVYNHTAEGNHLGPTISFKGIDNGAYYRLVDEDRSSYFDTTGTGNSLNVSHPAALGLIMDSLRYWVTEMHVDGFRFDLATTLTRQAGEAEVHSAFLDLIHQDPVLAPVKMIAEPWDTQGYQVGGFPADWSEWNGKFRDDLRDFWGGADSRIGGVSQRILGSPDVYEASRRSPLCSVNFITAHDGFTLADLTSYAHKHNAANGEDNEDGESDNRSTNSGAEGPTEEPAVIERRNRMRRNFLATLLLSAGVPMILGGDEIARTQGGNNNAYCQDNEISWYDWSNADDELRRFTADLVALRRAEPALRPDWYRAAASQEPDDATTSTVDLLRSDGNPFSDTDWDDPSARSIMFVFAHRDRDAFALLLNAAENGVEFTVPAAPDRDWELVVSSDPEQTVVTPVTTLIVRDGSFTLLRSRQGEA